MKYTNKDIECVTECDRLPDGSVWSVMPDQRKFRAQLMAETYPKKIAQLGEWIPHNQQSHFPQPQLFDDGSINWWETILHPSQGNEGAG